MVIRSKCHIPSTYSPLRAKTKQYCKTFPPCFRKRRYTLTQVKEFCTTIRGFPRNTKPTTATTTPAPWFARTRNAKRLRWNLRTSSLRGFFFSPKLSARNSINHGSGKTPGYPIRLGFGVAGLCRAKQKRTSASLRYLVAKPLFLFIKSSFIFLRPAAFLLFPAGLPKINPILVLKRCGCTTKPTVLYNRRTALGLTEPGKKTSTNPKALQTTSKADFSQAPSPNLIIGACGEGGGGGG